MELKKKIYQMDEFQKKIADLLYGSSTNEKEIMKVLNDWAKLLGMDEIQIDELNEKKGVKEKILEMRLKRVKMLGEEIKKIIDQGTTGNIEVAIDITDICEKIRKV